MGAGYLAAMQRVVSKNPEAVAFAAALDAAGVVVPPELCLVLGGDGTMLHAIQAHSGTPLTWLGLNFGHLGFLMNDVPAGNGADWVRAHLAAGAWQAHPFPRLAMRAETVGGTRSGRAVNDVYVERQSGTACHLRVWIDGHLLADRLVADGLIAATPLGSTAYSFSAGGSASHPLVRSVHLTAICPHHPQLSPMVLPATARIRVEVLEPERRPARVVVDGVEAGDVRTVEIAADDANHDVRLAFFDGHDFTGTLLRKVLRR